MWQLFEKGGPIMWPLFLLSVVTFAVVLERVVFLFRLATSRNKGVLPRMLDQVKADAVEKAKEVGFQSSDPVARVIAQGLEQADTCFPESISCHAEAELDRYEQGLSLLDTAVTLAPLLGLLGTVTGMIRSFGLLGAAELDAPVAITGGIAEALIATAFGLGIAIAALIPLNILKAKKERLAREIEDAATRVEIVLRDRAARVAEKQLRVA